MYVALCLSGIFPPNLLRKTKWLVPHLTQFFVVFSSINPSSYLLPLRHHSEHCSNHCAWKIPHCSKERAGREREKEAGRMREGKKMRICLREVIDDDTVSEIFELRKTEEWYVCT